MLQVIVDQSLSELQDIEQLVEALWGKLGWTEPEEFARDRLSEIWRKARGTWVSFAEVLQDRAC